MCSIFFLDYGGLNIKSKKIIILFCLIFCLLFSISSVCAHDNNIDNNQTETLGTTTTNDVVSVSSEDTNTNTGVEALQKVADDDSAETQNVVVGSGNENEIISDVEALSGEDTILLSTGDSEVLKDDDTGSYSDLVYLITLTEAGSTLTLYHDYKYNTETDQDYVNGITISKSITINFNGHTIDGNTQASIFTIQANNVVLKNINIINARGSSLGCGLYWLGDNGCLINANMSNCYRSSRTYGASGGISWWGNNGTIDKLDMTNCRMNWNGDTGRAGGSMSICGVGISISNSRFHDTITGGSYGLIAVLGSSSSVTFENCNFTEFIGTQSTYGAIFYEGTTGLTFKKCNFTNTKTRAVIGFIKTPTNFIDCYFESIHTYFSNLYYSNFINTTFKSNVQNQLSVIWMDSYFEDCTFIGMNVNAASISSGSVDQFINSRFINTTGLNFNKYSGGYVIVDGCNFTNTVINLQSGDKNSITNSIFNNPEDTTDITIKSNVRVFLNNNTANVSNSGVNFDVGYSFNVSVDGSGDGFVTLDYALSHIGVGGVINIYSGVYDLAGKNVNVNFKINPLGNVVLTNGSIYLKKGYELHDLTFTQLTSNSFPDMLAGLTMEFESSLINSTFINNTYGIAIYYNTTVKNCKVINQTMSRYLFQHSAHGSNSFIVDGVSVENSTITGLINTNGFSNCNFKNINITNSQLQNLWILNSEGVFNDGNGFVIENVNITKSNITSSLISNVYSWVRSLTFKDITVTDSNYTSKDTIISVKGNTVLENIKIVNLNFTYGVIVVKFDGEGDKINGLTLENYNTSTELINSNSIFTLNGLFLSNVNASTVYTLSDTGVMSLSGLCFTNTNFASGVLFNLTDKSSLKDSVFSDYTGHIIADGSNIVFSDCVFIRGNNSLLNGSALLVDGNYIKFSNCNFTNNTACNGAIYFMEGCIRPAFTGCNFTNNNAVESAGALYFNTPEGTGVSITYDDIVTGASINWDNLTNRSNGVIGNIIMLASIVYVINDTSGYEGKSHSARSRDDPGLFSIAYGVAGRDCLFVFIREGDVFDYTEDIMFGSILPTLDSGWIFQGNNSVIKGIGIQVAEDCGDFKAYNINVTGKTTGGSVIVIDEENVVFENCSIIDNIIDDAGVGAVVINAGNVNITDCSAINNRATNSSGAYGGAIFVNASNVNIIRTLFSGNGAYTSGSHIYLNESLQNIRLINNTFSDSVQIGSGACSGVVIQGINIVVTGNTFRNNTGKTGSALSIIGDVYNLVVTDNIFVNNTANSGSLYINIDPSLESTITVSSNTFMNNTAVYGGALFIDYVKNPELLNLGNTFINNTATLGGALFINGENIIILNSNFTGNHAVNGSAVYINANNVELVNCNFTGNNASDCGAVYVNGTGAVIRNALFYNNTADWGSAIYIAPKASVNLYSVTLSENCVKGGAEGAANTQGDMVKHGDICLDSVSNFGAEDLTLGYYTGSLVTGYQNYITNRTADYWLSVVYVNSTGGGTGFDKNHATTWDSALKHIVKEVATTIIFTGDVELIQKILSNYTNLTITTLNGTQVIRRNSSDNSKYLFICEFTTQNFMLNFTIFLDCQDVLLI